MNSSRDIAAECIGASHGNPCFVSAMSYVPYQQWEDIFDPHESLLCGTVFPSLNLPFAACCQKSARRSEHCKQRQFLEYVQQLGFMTDDIRLFLNTHPNCEEALRALKYYLAAEWKARTEYEAQYGALTLAGLKNCSHYDWINGIWPWETEG